MCIAAEFTSSYFFDTIFEATSFLTVVAVTSALSSRKVIQAHILGDFLCIMDFGIVDNQLNYYAFYPFTPLSFRTRQTQVLPSYFPFPYCNPLPTTIF